MSAVVWRLDQSLGLLTTEHLALQLDIARPQDGLRQVRCDGQSWSVQQLLGLAIPGMTTANCVVVDEAYVRGSDLIVRYAPTTADRFQPQLHWRFRSVNQAVGVEVLISMQTDSLDCRPTVEATSALSVGELLCAGPDERFCKAAEPGRTEWSTPVFVFRPDEASFSYVEMAYPADVVGFWIQPALGAEAAESGYRLLHQHLEKGVIRRLQVAAWFIPRDDDLDSAAGLFQRFIRSAPPLST
jgi:hypothetical protein